MIRYYLNLSNTVATKLKGKSQVHLLATYMYYNLSLEV